MADQTFITDLLSQQKLIMAQQDQQLGQVSRGLDKIKNSAVVIGEELSTQNKLLDDMSYEVSKLDTKLKITTQKVEKLSKPSPFWSWFF